MPFESSVRNQVLQQTTPKWEETPHDIRITCDTEDDREIVFDIIYDNFCTPLGSRCRVIVFPLPDLKFTCCERPKQLWGKYKHKKELRVYTFSLSLFYLKLILNFITIDRN